MERRWHAAAPGTIAQLTMKPTGAAGDQDVASALGLHVRKESLDSLDGAQEIDLHDPPGGIQGQHLQRAHQAHTSVAHCRSGERECSRSLTV